MKGLIVDVYSDGGGDYSNGGISSKHKRLVLIDRDIPEIFEADEELFPVKIIERTIFNEKYLHAEPIVESNNKSFMFGGCFIYSCDSRFREISPYPIPLHDRVE